MPKLTIVAGPNGAGKSTVASALLLRGTPYINADEIAKLLNGPGKDIQASRLLLETWDALSGQQANFAVETTLASRTLAPKVRALKEAGYTFHLYFLWLPDVEISIGRVAERVRNGGHNIPEETIRRRYLSGVRNFFDLYQPLADRWTFFDNVVPVHPRVIAKGRYTTVDRIGDTSLWEKVKGIQTMDDSRVRETSAADFYDEEVMLKRVRAAVRTAILEHKRNNNPICTWRDGKVVWIQPDDIVVDDED
jgi:predicted ABC-type ATPase